LFILFAAFYYQLPIPVEKQIALPFVTLLSGFGSPSSSVDAVAFLTDWLTFPTEATNLYVGMMSVTRYGQVVASVMGYAFVTMLVTMSYYGKLKLRVPALALSLLVGGAALAAATMVGRTIQGDVVAQDVNSYLTYDLALDVTRGIDTTIEGPGSLSKSSEKNRVGGVPPQEPILDRIRRSGELKIGFNSDSPPLSYRNNRGELVGFDIAFAYQLARGLNARLRLIPFTWGRVERDLMDRRFDLVLSGAYITNERLQRFAASEPYLKSPVTLIVRADAVAGFLSRAAIQAKADLTIGVLDVPLMIALAHRLLPKAKVVGLASYDDLPQHPEIDAAIWTLEQAKTWAAPRADYAAVVPRDLGGHFLIAYLMAKDALEFRNYLNYWLKLQDINGFSGLMVRKWIEGKPDPEKKPRWSILRNVLGW
jgi:ABC-type amino acid transport substrate-binding protein